MPEKQIEETQVYQPLDLLNAVIIGFMVGVYEVMGKGGTQAIINMAGQHVGKEILRYASDKGTPINSLDDFKSFVVKHGLVGQLDFYQSDHSTFVRVASCKTCPKKVGHYTFDGTACPWGGILSGVLSEILGEQYSCSSKLIPGEECILELKKSKTK